jgi:hypothetical protein
MDQLDYNDKLEKFQIGCSNRSPRLLDDINKKDTNAANILKDLTNLVQDKNNWFYLLNELRNHSMHRNMLNKKVAVHVGSNYSEEFFLNPLTNQSMNISIIEYLEKSLQN